MASDWINTPQKKIAPHKNPTHLLDYGGLRQIIERIQYIQEAEKSLICRSKKDDYDADYQSQSKSTSEEQNESTNFREIDMRSDPNLGAIEERKPKRRNSSTGYAGVQANSSPTRKEAAGGRR